MFLTRTVNLILVTFLLTISVEGQLLERLRNQIGLERYRSENSLIPGSEQCEPMTFSLPKPETGCCGLHKFDKSTFRAGKRIYKRNIPDEELHDLNMPDENDLDKSEDENHYEYDALPETRRKRDIIDGFKYPPSKFILSGRIADIYNYPWLVHLEIYNRTSQVSSGGGSLINSKFVLTAAHCVQLEFETLNDVKVVLAEYDTRNKTMDCVSYSNGAKICVNNVVMNPEQIYMHPKGHDIAMLRLKGIAPYSEFIRPICLPSFNIDTPRNRNLELIVAGWGAVHEGNPEYPVKQSTTVNLVPFKECKVLSPVPSGTMCAIGQHGEDACRGDSGGPLMAYDNGNYILVGIVSGKYVPRPCGSRVPTSYMNVYLYREWIQDVMTSH